MIKVNPFTVTASKTRYSASANSKIPVSHIRNLADSPQFDIHGEIDEKRT